MSLTATVATSGVPMETNAGPRTVSHDSRSAQGATREIEVARLSSPAMDDLGAPSSYLALEPGVDVFSRDGEKLGEVQYVLSDPDEDVFDGIVIDSSSLPGGLRFADALEVASIYERGVILGLSTADAERLPEPSENPGVMEVTGIEDVDRTELHEKLRRAWEVISGEGPDKR